MTDSIKKLNQVPAERLNLLLQEKKMKKQDLAKLIPISVQTVSKWVNGKANITEDNAQRIVEILMESPDRFSVDWLLGKSDFKSEQEYLDHAEKAKYLKRHDITFRLDSLASLIPNLLGIDEDGYEYEIIPLDEDNQPFYETNYWEDEDPRWGKTIYDHSICRVDLSNKSIKHFALTKKRDGEYLPYSMVLTRDELIVLLVELEGMIINKVNFEIRNHKYRFGKEDNNAEKK